MDAMVGHLLHLLEAKPYQAFLLPASILATLSYVLQKFFHHLEQDRLQRRNGVLAILANPHCPESMRPLMVDYLEAQAFQLATNAVVTKDQRQQLMALYQQHAQAMNPLDIGKAMDHLQFKDGILQRKTSYWIAVASFWIFLGFSAIALPILLAGLAISGLANLSNTLLLAELILLGLFSMWELAQIQATKRVLSAIAPTPHDSDDVLLPSPE